MLAKYTVLIAAAVLSVLIIYGAALASDPIVIKFSHVVVDNTPKGKMAIKFKELVAERLAGKVEVKLFPNSQLFGDDKEIKALLLGDVQLVAPALSKFERYTKKLQLFDLPFLFQDMAAVDKFQQTEEGLALLSSMEDKGLVGLGYLHNGMKQLSCTSPVRVPADASGLKFRIMTSDVLAAQFEAVRAVPVKKPFSEVFKLLQTQAIDGQENTYSNIYSHNFFEIQPYITESNHGVLDYMLVTSAEFWKGLPEEIRKEVKKALDEAIRYGNAIAIAQDLEDKQKIVDSRQTEIFTLNQAERNHWIEAMKSVWLRFEEEIGKDLIDAAYDSNMQ